VKGFGRSRGKTNKKKKNIFIKNSIVTEIYKKYNYPKYRIKFKKVLY
jgi:hypothetical protein